MPTLAGRIKIESRYHHLLLATAKQLKGTLLPAASIEIDDLIGAGAVALWEATAKFQKKTEATFGFYARMRVRGAMIDSIKGRPFREAVATKSLQGGSERGPVYMADLHPTAEQQMIAQEEAAAAAGIRNRKLERINFALADRDTKFLPISGRQKKVLKMRFSRGMTQTAAAERLGIRQQSLDEIESKTLKILRRKVAA